MALGDRRDVEHLRGREDLAGRVVRVADAHDLRPIGDRGLKLVEIEPPAPLLPQPHLLDLGAEAARDPVELHVVRQDDDDLVPGLDERREGEEVRLARPGRDEDVVQRRLRVERRDELPRRVAAHPVRVAEPLAAHRVQVTDRVLERERLDPRLGQVELHPVLPGRLHPLHREFGEPHPVNGSP